MSVSQASTRKFIDDSVARILAATRAFAAASDSIPARTDPLDIVIPIFNNASCLAKCLNALVPTLSEGDEVWLVDDASDEPEINDLLADFSKRWSSVQIISNDANLGFVGSANRALGLTRRDVVLLNSDTVVTSDWLEHLQDTLNHHPQSGIVCPLSDHASILSVVPVGYSDGTASATAVSQSSFGTAPIPTAVGFCMLIRRALLDQVGGFSRVFSPGYGEECDFSMRAQRAGWDVVACDQAVVFHSASGSFGRERSRRLRASHQALLDCLWPEYAPLVQSWWRDNPLRQKMEQSNRLADERIGVVHILHREHKVGGTERITRDLVSELSDRYRQTLLYPGPTRNSWCDFEERPATGFRELMLNNRWIRPSTRLGGHANDLVCHHSERALARVLRGMEPRIVHFHHMLHWDSLLLPSLARALGCRTVVSVHDFWLNCPIYNQLEYASGESCARAHAKADERCSACLRGHSVASGDDRLERSSLNAYVQLRHDLLQSVLKDVDRVFVPSRFMRDRLLRGYKLDPERVRIVSQGVRVPEHPATGSDGPDRVVAYFGGDQLLKGARLVLQLAQVFRNSGVLFRIYGRVRDFDPHDLPPNVELRGFYRPEDIAQAMKGIDLAVIPSAYEESFSMVLSECWAYGAPVLASARGALAERVKTGLNGWLVPDLKPDSWIEALRAVLKDDALERCRKHLPRGDVMTIEANANALDRAYQELLELPPPKPVPATRAEFLVHFRRRLQNLRDDRPCQPPFEGKRCLGIIRDNWGTANYRVRFPLQDLEAAGVCDGSRFHVVRVSGFNVGPALKESAARRIAVQPFLSDRGLKMMENLHRVAGLRLTLVVDDLWTDLPSDNPVRATLPDNLPQRLAFAADLCESVVLTTAPLREHLGLDHDNIHVINNALPEMLWGELRTPAPRAGDKVRIGWAGAPQHAGDLAFLEPVIRATSDVADWIFLGMCPDPLRALATEVHSMVTFDQYPTKLAALQLDIGVAPLTDNPFNRCKSHLKALEYGALGLPVVAADLEPYRNCPVTLAAPDDVEDWTFNLRQLANDRDMRLSHGASLRHWVTEGNLSPNRRTDWLTALGISRHAD